MLEEMNAAPCLAGIIQTLIYCVLWCENCWKD